MAHQHRADSEVGRDEGACSRLFGAPPDLFQLGRAHARCADDRADAELERRHGVGEGRVGHGEVDHHLRPALGNGLPQIRRNRHTLLLALADIHARHRVQILGRGHGPDDLRAHAAQCAGDGDADHERLVVVMFGAGLTWRGRLVVRLTRRPVVAALAEAPALPIAESAAAMAAVAVAEAAALATEPPTFAVAEAAPLATEPPTFAFAVLGGRVVALQQGTA